MAPRLPARGRVDWDHTTGFSPAYLSLVLTQSVGRDAGLSFHALGLGYWWVPVSGVGWGSYLVSSPDRDATQAEIARKWSV